MIGAPCERDECRAYLMALEDEGRALRCEIARLHATLRRHADESGRAAQDSARRVAQMRRVANGATATTTTTNTTTTKRPAATAGREG